VLLVGGVLLGVSLEGGEPSEATPPPSTTRETVRERPDAAAIAARRRRALARLSRHIEGERRPLTVSVLDCRGAVARGADVTVLGADGRPLASGIADDAGRFEARVPKDGAVTVVAGVEDHEGGAGPSTDPAMTVGICPGGTVEGRVLDRRGDPVADVTVTLGDGLDVAVTDARGEFVLTDVDLVADYVSATAEASGAERELTPLEPFEVRRVELVLETGRRLVGVVLDPHGEAVPYATLTATDFSDTEVARARSDRHGRFWLKEVPFTPVTVVADDGDGGVGSLYVEASEGHDDLVVTLQPAGRIAVDYRGPYRGPFDVIALVGGSDEAITGRVASLSGYGDVAILPAPRKYWVRYGEEQTLCGEVLLTPGEVATVKCGEARPASIVGRIIDRDGVPVPGATITVRSADGAVERSAAASWNGEFLLEVAANQTVGVFLEVSTIGDFYLPTRRRNVPLSPGETTDVGDLRVDRVEDFPGLRSRERFGGLGAQIDAVDDGIRIGRVVKGGPLDLAGVEAGEVIIAIDEAASGFLPALDAVRVLRGPPGSAIRLRLRSLGGATREVEVERSVIDVGASGWVN